MKCRFSASDIRKSSARIVAAMTSNAADMSELRVTVLEAKEYLQLLVDWKINKVKRDCNNVAHELGQLLARRNVHTATSWGQAPACVLSLLNSDCNWSPS